MLMWVRGFGTDVYAPILSPLHVSINNTHGPVQREAHCTWEVGMEEVVTEGEKGMEEMERVEGGRA